jgi:hypothetical protein
MLQAVLEAIDRAIEEAALGLGAGPWAHVSSRHPSARGFAPLSGKVNQRRRGPPASRCVTKVTDVAHRAK